MAIGTTPSRQTHRKIERLFPTGPLEVNVRKDDAALVRNVVRALLSPEEEQATRALLREHFGSGQAEGLKALLAAAPLEGIDLRRERELGRDVDL